MSRMDREPDFQRLAVPATPVPIRVNGRSVSAHPDDTVASALLADGLTAFARHPVTGALQAPLCMIGICFGCLCEVDGRPGVQACLTPVRAGMQVRIDGDPIPGGVEA